MSSLCHYILSHNTPSDNLPSFIDTLWHPINHRFIDMWCPFSIFLSILWFPINHDFIYTVWFDIVLVNVMLWGGGIHRDLSTCCQLKCDGKLIVIPPGTQGIIVLNVNSYAGAFDPPYQQHTLSTHFLNPLIKQPSQHMLSIYPNLSTTHPINITPY